MLGKFPSCLIQIAQVFTNQDYSICTLQFGLKYGEPLGI